VLVLAALLAGTIALRLVSPQLLRSFLDDASTGAPLSALTQVALVYLAAALVLQVGTVAQVYVAEYVGLTATNRLRADLTRHVLRLDPDFHATHTPGELIERTDGDVATLGGFFSRLVVYLFGNLVLLAGVLVLLAQVSLVIGAAAALCAAVGVLMMTWLRRFVVPRFTALRQANAELYGLIEERLAGTEDVRANGGVGYVLQRMLQRSRNVLWADLKARLSGSVAFQSAFFSMDMATAATVAIGAWYFERGALSIGTLYLIFAYTQSLQQPLQAIVRQVQDLQQAAASIGRVRALLGESSQIQDGKGEVPPPGPLSVEVDGVTFAYDGAEPVLRNVSLHLSAGSVLGLLGRTGSGKTTLSRLLFRLYDPQAGAIRAGSVDLREPPVAALRSRIGVVTQDVQLFHATVRDNVTFFDSSVSDSQIIAVLDELGLGSWWQALPEGLNTRLAPGGNGLSAGEAQLLAFARVFLKDPGLVILDEASSRLDAATERLLERAVDRLLDGRTAIVIAHRLATVERADQIAILEAGEVAEHGERTQLAADPASRFSQLLRAGLHEVLV
jgi:ATP-binding cassette, subfamily B, bacterial